MGFKKKDYSKNIAILELEKKYRPITFDQYLGNENTKRTLSMMLKNGTLPHFILLKGGSGTGKTSFGRLLEREILCNNKTADGHACGVCEICKEITDMSIKLGKDTKGSREPNLSADTGKADILAVIQDVSSPPLPPYTRRVVILDEAHKMTNGAQNAMLKSLEDIPEHLYYILCTTEPERLLDTVRGRASEFKIKKPTVPQLIEKLQWICEQENIVATTEALKLIVRKKFCVPRNSIKALDKLKNYAEITEKVVSEDLDIVEAQTYLDFFDIMKKDIVDIITTVDALIESGQDIADFVDGLLRFIMDAVCMVHNTKLEFYNEKLYKNIRATFKGYTYDDFALMIARTNKYARTAFSSPDRAEASLVELAIELGRPTFFDKKMSKEVNNTEKDNEKALDKYRVKQAEIKEDEHARNDIVESVSQIAGLFPDSYIVAEELPDAKEGSIAIPEEGEEKSFFEKELENL